MQYCHVWIMIASPWHFDEISTADFLYRFYTISSVFPYVNPFCFYILLFHPMWQISVGCFLSSCACASYCLGCMYCIWDMFICWELFMLSLLSELCYIQFKEFLLGATTKKNPTKTFFQNNYVDLLSGVTLKHSPFTWRLRWCYSHPWLGAQES